MITAELRGGNKPSLNEALGWIGSKVDDIYGASVGRLEDVWIDPGTGAPKWLLVKEGRFGGRTTLIPFEDATAGAGHVWIPYERDVVREAPAVSPGAPLTQSVETALRSHYAANKPAPPTHHRARGQAAAQPAVAQPAAAPAAAAPAPAVAHPHAEGHQVHQYQLLQDATAHHDPHQPLPPVPPSPPARPPQGAHGGSAAHSRPRYAPQPQQPPPGRPLPPAPRHGGAPPPARYPAPAGRPAHGAPASGYRQPPAPGGQAPQHSYAPPAYAPPPQRPPEQREPAPPAFAPARPGQAHGTDDPDRPVAIPIIHALDQPYRVEVQLEGEISISGELKGFSIKPSAHGSGEPGQ